MKSRTSSFAVSVPETSTNCQSGIDAGACEAFEGFAAEALHRSCDRDGRDHVAETIAHGCGYRPDAHLGLADVLSPALALDDLQLAAQAFDTGNGVWGSRGKLPTLERCIEFFGR